MKKTIEQDVQRLNGILKSINNIEKCFKVHNINNSNDLKNDEVAQAACTQFITNIYESKKKLQDETFNKLVELNRIKISGARHIASHDYDSVNFIVIHSICCKLIESDVLSELQEIIASIKENENGNEN
jgi:uncharacterized protein with HEPN domain